MVCDITQDFHKLAKWKASPRQDDKDALQPSNVLMHTASGILRDVQKIASFWEEKRRGYSNPAHFLPSKSMSFTDLEREELEESMLDSYKLCEQRLEELKMAVLAASLSPQVAKVHAEVVHYLTDRIKRGIASTKDNQKKRLNRPFFLSKKLVPEGIELSRSTIVLPKPKTTAASPTTGSLVSSTSPPPPDLPPTAPPATASPTRAPLPHAHGESSVDVASSSSPRRPPSPATTTTRPPVVASPFQPNDDAIVFSEAETRQFHAENVQLHRHLHEEIDAARRVEKQVHDIRDMMHQFASEIGGQTEKMHVVAQEADQVADNVGHGNQSLKQAADHGQGLGFIIFCCYVGASSLLLFFHYY